ncbi:uncharacterized protein [Arachis hypogaea]
MVSQRQRLARKRFKEEHPELFPKPEPTPPKDPDKKKKKKKKSNTFKSSSIKRRSDGSEELGVSKKPFKSNYRKHPLRVPGMKPGDTCFICKAADHIAKSCPQKAEWEKNKICLRCRRRGHRAKNCPEVQVGANYDKYCYNCGETGHSLANCPHPVQEGGTKFAECFVCKQQGHLSKNCPQNAHGIYPKGGCCKICGGVTHLARDCPDKGKKAPFAANGPADGSMRLRNEQRPCGTVTKFASGDDIEDDFMTDDINNRDKDKSSKSKDGQAKPKKGPKVVNFSWLKFVASFIGSLPLFLSHFFSCFFPKSLTHFLSHFSFEAFSINDDIMANAASGMAVNDACKLKFLELKAKRNYRFIVFRIENQEVVVEKLGSPDETYDDFTASLPANECRYAVFDFDFTTDENCQKSKIFFIAWSPDTSRVREKMVYASSKDRFKRELDGIQVELQATDPSEMSFDIIKARAI